MGLFELNRSRYAACLLCVIDADGDAVLSHGIPADGL